MREIDTYYFDERWIGEHGIGRFANELFSRLKGLNECALKGHPCGALDPIKTGLWLLSHPQRFFFTPGFNAPLMARSRSVITVHDLIHIDVEGCGGTLQHAYYAGIVKPACRKAYRVLTVSEYSRQRIIEWSGAEASKVINVGNGISDVFSAVRKPDETPPLPFPFFFCVSNRRPHKNEKRLIDAFAKADVAHDVQLVLTGECSAELGDYIHQLGMTSRIRFAGRLDDEQLAAHYRAAIGLLFPSLYEGFGLPIVEAMASGTPVLTSTTTSLPEIAGDAALLVDPYSVDEIAQGISRLYQDSALCEQLRRKGIERASHFSWDKVAERARNALR